MRKSKVTKKILASIMSASLIIGTLTGVGVVNKETVKAKDYGINNPRIGADGSVTWDKVKFGSYKQSAEFEYEPIKWRILSVDKDNNALLLADKGLDCKPYNENGVEKVNEDGESYTDYSCTWETSTLRSWLNDDFYKEAFTEAEQVEIKQVTVKNDDNPSYGTEGGNDTTDKVYLLSIEEASNSAYGFDSTFETESAARECKVTDYAYLNGASRISSLDYAGNGYWWLRSPGCYSNYAAYTDHDGWGNNYGYYVNLGNEAIRPALRINLSSSVWEAAGTVSTEEEKVDPNQPTQTPKPSLTPEPTKTPEATPTPSPSPSQAPAITATPTPAPANDSTQTADDKAQLKTIKLSSVVCKRNSTKISGKVSVSGATVKIKVGSKAYRKAKVKGKKFTLKVIKLKKKTKVIIKVTKSGYKSLSKTYKVK